MYKYISTVLIFIFLSIESKAQGPVKWYSFEEALELMKVEKKKIVIDVYTDWCGWCKKMDKSTFQKTQIANYLNENYYPVKLNAEQKEVINFAGQEFKYVNKGRSKSYHEFALAVTRGQLSYPTVVFIDEDLNIIQSIPGFRTAHEFEMIMTYFGNNRHKEEPWSTYQNNYVPMRIRFKDDLNRKPQPVLPAKYN